MEKIYQKTQKNYNIKEYLHNLFGSEKIEKKLMEKVPKICLGLWFFVLNYGGGSWSESSALVWIISCYLLCFVIEIILKLPCCCDECNFSGLTFLYSIYSGVVACLVLFIITYGIDSSGSPYSTLIPSLKKDSNSKWPAILIGISSFTVALLVLIESKIKNKKK